MDQQREFTGVFIPRHIIEDASLSMSEMIIYAEINCFEVCYKSNESLGSRWGLKPNTISIIISKLIDKGYVVSQSFNGRSRELIAIRDNPNQRQSMIKIKGCPSEESKAGFEKNHTIDNSKENNKILGPSPSAPASDIQYVPLEDEIKSLRKKEVKSDPELTVKRDIIGFFIRKSKEYHNDYCPVINLPAALRLVNGCLDFSNPTEIKEWIEWYLQSDLYEILGSDIKTCLCTASYNKYKDHRRKYD